MTKVTAESVCEEFLPIQTEYSPNFNVLVDESEGCLIISTITTLSNLSALSLRMHQLGWLLVDTNRLHVHGDKNDVMAQQKNPFVIVGFSYKHVAPIF